jgi:hypothetical protein
MGRAYSTNGEKILIYILTHIFMPCIFKFGSMYKRLSV